MRRARMPMFIRLPRTQSCNKYCNALWLQRVLSETFPELCQLKTPSMGHDKHIYCCRPGRALSDRGPALAGRQLQG